MSISSRVEREVTDSEESRGRRSGSDGRAELAGVGLGTWTARMLMCLVCLGHKHRLLLFSLSENREDRTGQDRHGDGDGGWGARQKDQGRLRRNREENQGMAKEKKDNERRKHSYRVL